MLDIINIIMFTVAVRDSSISYPYASSDEDKTYQPPDDSESNDSDDSSNNVDKAQ